MFDIPAFFIDQRIDQDADERTIKRAYAKALKQIDQDNDLEGFQNLRESYERALAWERSKEWRAQYIAEQNAESAQIEDANLVDDQRVTQSSEIAPVVGELDLKSESAATQVANESTVNADEVISESTSEVSVAPEQNSQYQASNAEENDEEQTVYAIDIARHIFHEFLQHLNAKSEEVGQTESLLRLYLDDERLINVEIRDLFEWLIAGHLAQGWQAGNGDLFGAAVKCFAWNQDKHRLLRFDEFGYYLDRALDEMSAFNLQEEARSSRQVGLIRLARNDAPPTKQFLRENIYFIDDMLSSYPTWLAMVTKLDNLQTWHKRAEEYKFFQPPKIDFSGIKSKFDGFNIPPGVIVFIILILIKMIIGFSEPSKQPIVVDSRSSEATPIILSSEELFKKGELYFSPQFGGARDIDLAEVYWKRAAELGSKSAQLRLQELYANDLFGRKNIQESRRYSDMAGANKPSQ
ncbi:sel1 repeat family protein [Undibacterium flavidum]|uniref:Sel1 repeat family protein n=1 Tax=Undibacterium flavidum TaxID=2762297 RepID=A0ABR6YD67_9BURK|nr:sel1 repeat family protein [Undibacterium flavidum]MBC3874473.1 sel1 repeat family protein [Undibacterium flavidum]